MCGVCVCFDFFVDLFLFCFVLFCFYFIFYFFVFFIIKKIIIIIIDPCNMKSDSDF